LTPVYCTSVMNDISIYPAIRTPFLAEAVCACLIEQGVLAEDMSITIKGAFKKSYSNDVAALHIDDERRRINASLIINRNGMYDLLPEGLFHQTRGMMAVRSVQDAVQEHRKYREEERYARKFFAPLEEMVFRYRIEAERSERSALANVKNEQLTESLFEFWNIEKNLPKKEALRMLKLMPYVNTIKGSAEAITEGLKFILDKDVYIEETQKRNTGPVHAPAAQSLDNMRLGTNSVIGSNSDEYMYGWTIRIALPADDVEAYVDDAPLDRLLTRFAEIFIPIDRDVWFEFDTMDKVNEHEYILGYGCTI